jgi:hypothetical protein
VDLPDNAARFSVKNVPGVPVWDERSASQEADTSQGTEETAMQPSGSEETFGVAETSEKVEEPLAEIQPPAEAAAPEPEEIPEKFREARDIFFSMPETFLVLVGCEYDRDLTSISDHQFFNFYVRYLSKLFNRTQNGTPQSFPKTFLGLEWLIIDLCNIMSGNVKFESLRTGLLWNEKIHYPQWEEVMKFPEKENYSENKKICLKMPALSNRLKRIGDVRHELFSNGKTKNHEIKLLLDFLKDPEYGYLLTSLKKLFVNFYKIVLLFLGAEWRDLISGTYEKIPYTKSLTNNPKNKKETIGLKLNSIKENLNKTMVEFSNILGFDFKQNLFDNPSANLNSAENLNKLFNCMNTILTEIVTPFSQLR